MGDDSLEERILEVINIPSTIEDDLLQLYFENKRSGGGAITSFDREGGKATIVFEDAEVAARVFSKPSHTLNGVTLNVQRKPPCDPQRFLLQGLNPNSTTELVALYVENVFDVEDEEYRLFPSPAKNSVLIQLLQPLSEDFQSISARVSGRHLDKAKLNLQRVERPNSILVENLHPNTTEEMLSLYFESNRGGGGEVTNVKMMAEGIARVFFQDFESVDKVVTSTHTLENSELNVKPYFSFLVLESSPPSSPHLNGTSGSVPMEIDPTPVVAPQSKSPASLTPQAYPLVVAHAQFSPQTITTSLASASPTSSGPPSMDGAQAIGCGSIAVEADEMVKAPVRVAAAASAEVAAPSTKPKPVLRLNAGPVNGSITISDSVKLSLLEASGRLRKLQMAHPGSSLRITKDSVLISAPDQPGLDGLKSSVLEFLSGIAQSTLSFEPQKAEFLAREDIKARVLQTLEDQGLLLSYAVTDSVVLVTCVPSRMVNQACESIKSLVSEVRIPVLKDYECNLYCQEWCTFLQTLSLCSASVVEEGAKISVVTLKGMEEEAQAKVKQFLVTPIHRETVISMEPGKLKYLQIHCEQLLADIDQVTLFPLETGDGLTISGKAAECQMAEELLRSVVDSICTRTITVRQPGAARFLVEQEGSSILAEMQAKFQVYISMDKVHWEPLKDEDIFLSGWKLIGQENFERNSDASVSISKPAGLDVHQLMERSRIEEAKQLLSAIDDNQSDGPGSLISQNMSEEDIYTACGGEALDGTDASAMNTEESPQALSLTGSEDAEVGLARQLSLKDMDASSLDENARLSLAIQYSMESTRMAITEEDDEDELQKALALSLQDFRAANAGVNPVSEESQLKQAMEASLQDTIQAANIAEIFVFAGYDHDLIRTDIALGKKASLRQCEEKVESRNLKNLTAHYQKCLDLIRRKHAVEIRVEGTTAIISGFKDFVTEAVPTVKDFARRIGNTISDTEILKTVQWVWHVQGSAATDIPYPPKVTVYLENAWKMKLKKTEILFDHQPHVIDFEKMQEINVASGMSVCISRKLVDSAGLTAVVPEEELSLLSSLPDVCLVDENSDEFEDVVREFYDTIQDSHNKIKIVKVEKLMNSLLHNQYKLKKASMDQNSTSLQVERTLFHGTSETSVKEICVHGFNRSFCGKNATVYGQGVYFAVNSALSVSDTYSPPNADGHKFIFMAKVLTGDYTIGKHEMKTAPLKESSQIPLRYDSVTDNLTLPTLFVIFNDTQAYPQYLVTCQKTYS